MHPKRPRLGMGFKVPWAVSDGSSAVGSAGAAASTRAPLRPFIVDPANPMVADGGGDAEQVKQVSQGLAGARGPLARQCWTPVLRVPIPTVKPEAEADEVQDFAHDSPPRKRPAILTTPKPQSHTPLPSKTKLPSLHRRPLVETSSTPSRANTGQEASTSEATESGLYYKVLYAKSKKCVRRNTKNWEDGVLELRGGKSILYNDAGKKVTESKTKVCALREDDTLQVGGWDLEVYTPIAEGDFFSGKAFMASMPAKNPLIANEAMESSVHVLGAAQSSMPVGPMKKHMLSSSGGQAVIFPEKAPASMFSVDAPNALVLSAAGEPRLSKANKPAAAVVMDPYLASKLRPHQREGVKFLYESVMGLRNSDDHRVYTGCLLADEMGLGKTLQCISLMWTLLQQGPHGPHIKKVLVVCPATLVQSWSREIRKWLGNERLTSCTIQGGQQKPEEMKQRVNEWANKFQKKTPVLVTSYEMVRKFVKELAAAQAGLLICDEAHRLKKTGGNKTISDLNSLGCTRRVLCTGTPIQNDLGEFYSMLDFAAPDVLGPLKRFNTIFAKPISEMHDRLATEEQQLIGKERSAQLTRISAPFVLRRSADINAKYLPAKEQFVVFCRLTRAQERIYKEVGRAALYGLGGSPPLKPFTAIHLLRQLCNSIKLMRLAAKGDEGGAGGSNELESDEGQNTQALREHLVSQLPEDYSETRDASGKLHVLADLLTSIGENSDDDRVVIVSQFTSTLDLIREVCERQGLQCSRLDGSTPADTRMDLVRSFNDGVGKVFLLSTKAGGAGLNLIGANRLILFDPDWNPANDLQAMARVWRDGQTKKVFVYRLVTTASVEEKMYQRQLVKTEMADSMGFTGEERADKQFTAAELRDLFTYNLTSATGCDTHAMVTRNAKTATLWTDVTNNPPDASLAQVVENDHGMITFIGRVGMAVEACNDKLQAPPVDEDDADQEDDECTA